MVGSSSRTRGAERACACHASVVAKFVYIDETGADGTASKKQPHLTLVAAIVDEDNVQQINAGLRQVAMKHLGWIPDDLEFHGYELWGGLGYWKEKGPSELIAVYEDAIELLDTCDVDIAHASIDKARLHARYGGAADENAYRLALQFLLEKIDRHGSSKKVLVADEAKEQELRAVRMVSEMQEWGGGEVPGIQLKTVIDTLHFVRSHASAGVQVADLVAYVIQRSATPEHHPDAQAALNRIQQKVGNRTRTYRQRWPT